MKTTQAGRIKALVMAAVAAVLTSGADAASYTWSGAVSGDWGTAGNWDSTPSFVAGTELIFHADGAGNLTTFLGAATRTIGGLTFNENCDSEIIIRTYSTATGSGGTNRVLFFDNGEQDAFITVAAGAEGNISVGLGGRVEIQSDLVITHNGTGMLRLNDGNWFVDEVGDYFVVKKGAGTLTYGGNGNGNTGTGGIIKLDGGMKIHEGRVRLQRDDGFGFGVLIMTGGGLSAIGGEARSIANNYFFQGNLILSDVTDNGILTFTTAGTGTLTANAVMDVRSGVALNGVLGDDGSGYSLTKTGAGALALGGANTFSGGVTVQEGRLRIGHDEALAAGSTLTMTGGALSGNSGAARALGNDYSFSGAITLGHVSDSGALTLSGTGTLSADTTLDTVVNTTLSAAIGQSGGDWSLTKTGAGMLVLTLNQVNAFAGGLIIQEGIVQVNNSQDRLGTGLVTLDGGALKYIGQSANATINRNMTVDAANGTIDLDTGDKYIDWAGTVSGSGTLTIIGGGLLKLSGNNDHTGDIAVNAGSLQVNGTHTGGGMITVASGATLGGTGTAGATTIESGGILAPGASVGELTLGDLTLDGGSTLAWEFDGVGGVDELNVDGLWKGAGSGWTFDFLNTGYEGTFTLIRFATGDTDFSTGDFSITNLDPAYSAPDGIQVNSGAGEVILTVIPEPASLGALGMIALAALLRRRLRR